MERASERQRARIAWLLLAQPRSAAASTLPDRLLGQWLAALAQSTTKIARYRIRQAQHLASGDKWRDVRLMSEIRTELRGARMTEVPLAVILPSSV